MRAWILSDLHCDHGTIPPPVPSDADIALIAGDIMNYEWLLDVAQRLPVVFVAGNHEFYGHDVPGRLRDLDKLAGVLFLENDSWYAYDQGIHIAGATLWTDYNGGDPVAMERARRGMWDHIKIRDFQPSDALALHSESLDYLRNSGADVIVTHHAPHPGSVHSRYKGNSLNYAFFSDVIKTFDNPPKLWVHGHCHDSFSYCVGRTRVVCNPHGYPGENREFNPSLIVEI